MLRFHGSRDKQTFELIGTNSRLDAIQAAALRVFLPHLRDWNEGRRAGAARYAELGLGNAVELPLDEPGHVYHMYVVRTPERARIAAALKEAGIASASYYVTPLHLQPAMRYLGYGPGSLPETERAAADNLALPMWGCIGADVQDYKGTFLDLSATVCWRPLRHGAALVGYRYLKIDVEGEFDNDTYDIDIALQGFYVGLELRF